MGDGAHTDGTIPEDELVAILHAVAQSPDFRVRAVEVAGQRVWIKRYDTEPLALAKRLHGFVSPLLLPTFLRNSAPAIGPAGVARESAKIARFRAAGLRTPAILYQNGSLMIQSDVAPTLWERVADLDAPSQRHMLFKAFEALGEVHRAGLVHGRPHLRDMSLGGDEVCFFDFEEEPEAVMPSAEAQARDLVLLMLPVAALEPDIETQRDCLQAWMKGAPVAAIRSLIRMLRFCGPVIWILRVVPASLQGSDLRRFIAGSRFLVASISDMDSVIAKREQGAGLNG